MKIDAKVNFVNQMTKKLSGILTIDQMNEFKSVCNEVLDSFDMREIPQEEGDEDGLLDAYVSTLQVECRSEKTIARYRYVIQRMINHVGVKTRQITVYHLRSYLSDEKKRGISDSTLEGTREVFTAYFNWLQRENLIESNPTVNLGKIKVARKKKKIYTDIELEKLYRNCKTPRDMAMVHFLRSTGCRVSEMVGLNVNDIDLQALECVVHGKGDKERTVYLDSLTASLLDEYISGRKAQNDALFTNRYGDRIQTGGVRVVLNSIAKRAGVSNVHPHKFRRTLATNLSYRGMPIQEISNILGHDKLDTTMTYVVLNKDNTKNQYKKYA